MARFVSTGLHVRARTLRCRRICRSWRRIRPRSRPGVRFVAVRITSVLPSHRNARSTTSSSASSLRSRTSTSFFSIPSPRTGSTSRAFARLLPPHRRPTSPIVPWLSSTHVRFVSPFETNAKYVRSSDRSRKRDGNDRRDRASLHLSIEEATGEPISLPNRRCTAEASPGNWSGKTEVRRSWVFESAGISTPLFGAGGPEVVRQARMGLTRVTPWCLHEGDIEGGFSSTPSLLGQSQARVDEPHSSYHPTFGCGVWVSPDRTSPTHEHASILPSPPPWAHSCAADDGASNLLVASHASRFLACSSHVGWKLVGWIPWQGPKPTHVQAREYLLHSQEPPLDPTRGIETAAPLLCTGLPLGCEVHNRGKGGERTEPRRPTLRDT